MFEKKKREKSNLNVILLHQSVGQLQTINQNPSHVFDFGIELFLSRYIHKRLQHVYGVGFQSLSKINFSRKIENWKKLVPTYKNSVLLC